jgi:hypothetical protein
MPTDGQNGPSTWDDLPRIAKPSIVPFHEGFQMEWHAGGIDVEIEFTAEGAITSVFWGRSDAVR